MMLRCGEVESASASIFQSLALAPTRKDTRFPPSSRVVQKPLVVDVSQLKLPEKPRKKQIKVNRDNFESLARTPLSNKHFPRWAQILSVARRPEPASPKPAPISLSEESLYLFEALSAEPGAHLRGFMKRHPGRTADEDPRLFAGKKDALITREPEAGSYAMVQKKELTLKENGDWYPKHFLDTRRFSSATTATSVSIFAAGFPEERDEIEGKDASSLATTSEDDSESVRAVTDKPLDMEAYDRYSF